MNPVVIDEWFGLYKDSWRGLIYDDAFTHPAKFSRALIRRIYDHVIEEGWATRGNSVVDPFGGVALGALDAMRLGLNWYGCELEARFVGLGGQNIALWNERFSRMPNWGTARLLNGDSRKLAQVLRAADVCVSSPPYASGCAHTGGDDPKPEHLTGGAFYGVGISSPPYSESMNRAGGIDGEKSAHVGGPHSQMNRSDTRYGESEGQLGAMKEGDHSIVISSPPYVAPPGHGGGDWTINNSKGLYPPSYGSTEGQLGAMPEGQLSVSSPPFPQPYTSGGGINVKGYEPQGTNRRAKDPRTGERHYQSKGGDRAEGNLETLDAGDFECAVSSPPYEGQDVGGTRRELDKYDHGEKRDLREYGNLGSGETFWSASRLILEQLHQVLSPNAHAVFVVKAFVRDKKIVDFPGQWAQLCEAVGFKLLHDHHALLTEHYGTQGGFENDKELSVARKSFFRRLAEKKGSPRIDYENVLCFRRI